MKISRNKKVSKILAFYKKHFGYTEPYNILIDGTFCAEALKNKVEISDQLPKYLCTEVRIVTTYCCINEMENLMSVKFPLIKGAWLILKKFATHKCGHEKSPIQSSDCIKSMLRNNTTTKYIAALFDDSLREEIRHKITGTPILFLSRSAPSLERPPKPLRNKIDKQAQKTLDEHDVEKLEAITEALGIKKETTGVKRKRLTGAEQKRRKKRKIEEMKEKVKKENDEKRMKVAQSYLADNVEMETEELQHAQKRRKIK